MKFAKGEKGHQDRKMLLEIAKIYRKEMDLNVIDRPMNREEAQKYLEDMSKKPEND